MINSRKAERNSKRKAVSRFCRDFLTIVPVSLITIAIALQSKADMVPPRSLEIRFAPIEMPKGPGPVTFELSFKKKTWVDEFQKDTYDCKEVEVRIQRLDNIEYSGDTAWTVKVDSGVWYRSEINVVIPANDTSGITVTVKCCRIPNPTAWYFVTTGDTLESFRGNPRGTHPPEFRPWEHPIIDKEAFSNIDPNDRWYKFIDVEGNHIGYYHFTREKSERYSASLKFTHETVVNQNGIRAHFYRTFVEDDVYFTPQFLIYQGTEGNDTGSFTVNFANNTIQHDFDKKKLKKPKDCIVFFDLFEIVRNLPFDSLTDHECTSYDPEGNDPLKRSRIKYRGTELVSFGDPKGEKMPLHKFVISTNYSGTKHIGTTSVYLDDSHMVIIIQDDREYMTLTSEAAAIINTGRFNWEEFENKLNDSDSDN